MEGRGEVEAMGAAFAFGSKRRPLSHRKSPSWSGNSCHEDMGAICKLGLWLSVSTSFILHCLVSEFESSPLLVRSQILLLGRLLKAGNGFVNFHKRGKRRNFEKKNIVLYKLIIKSLTLTIPFLPQLHFS